jgi:hypothetical protein
MNEKLKALMDSPEVQGLIADGMIPADIRNLSLEEASIYFGALLEDERDWAEREERLTRKMKESLTNPALVAELINDPDYLKLKTRLARAGRL